MKYSSLEPRLLDMLRSPIDNQNDHLQSKSSIYFISRFYTITLRTFLLRVKFSSFSPPCFCLAFPYSKAFMDILKEQLLYKTLSEIWYRFEPQKLLNLSLLSIELPLTDDSGSCILKRTPYAFKPRTNYFYAEAIAL